MSPQFNAPRSRAFGSAPVSFHSPVAPSARVNLLPLVLVASAAAPAQLHPPALGRRPFGDGLQGNAFMQQTNQPKTPALAFEGFIDSARFRYFRGREFTAYWQRTRDGHRNTVPAVALWPNVLRPLAVLDELRAFLGYPLTITSSYRSPLYNRAVGGAPNSYHCRFLALDFQGAQERPQDWYKALVGMRGDMFGGQNGVPRFQFRGGIGLYSTFVHVDCRGADVDFSG